MTDPHSTLEFFKDLHGGLCKAEAERDSYRRALAELVRLKDGPHDDAYRRDKPLAWTRARALLQASAEDYSGDLRRGNGHSDCA